MDILNTKFNVPNSNKIYKIGSQRGIRFLNNYQEGGAIASKKDTSLGKEEYSFEDVGKLIILDETGLVAQIRVQLDDGFKISPVPVIRLHTYNAEEYFNTLPETKYTFDYNFKQWFTIFYSQWDLAQKLSISDAIKNCNISTRNIDLSDEEEGEVYGDVFPKRQIFYDSSDVNNTPIKKLSDDELQFLQEIEDLDKLRRIKILPYHFSRDEIKTGYNLSPCTKIEQTGLEVDFTKENASDYVLIYDQDGDLINCYKTLDLYIQLFMTRGSSGYYEVLDDKDIMKLLEKGVYGRTTIDAIKVAMNKDSYSPGKWEVLEMKQSTSYYDINHMIVDEESLIKILQAGNPNIVQLFPVRNSRGLVSKAVALGIENQDSLEFFSDPRYSDGGLGSAVSAYHGGPKTRKMLYRAEFFEPSVDGFVFEEEEPEFEPLSFEEWWDKYKKKAEDTLPYGGNIMSAMRSGDRDGIRTIQTLKNEYTRNFLTEERRQYDIAIKELREQRKAKREEVKREEAKREKESQEGIDVLGESKQRPVKQGDILELMESLNCDDFITIQDKPVIFGKSDAGSSMDLKTLYLLGTDGNGNYNFTNCDKGPSKGGYALYKLRQIAEQMGIINTMKMGRSQVCKAIEELFN